MNTGQNQARIMLLALEACSSGIDNYLSDPTNISDYFQPETYYGITEDDISTIIDEMEKISKVLMWLSGHGESELWTTFVSELEMK